MQISGYSKPATDERSAIPHLRSLHNMKSKQSPTITNGDIELNKYRDFADMKKIPSDSVESIRFSINWLFENTYFMKWMAGEAILLKNAKNSNLSSSCSWCPNIS
ncbi:Uncharacterized protein Fot_31647 [Forsythia ovata]|uniref:Uncharacterized protein n=1 Tax=Forsythia ovata TaxID=205694 RepID=A0ABD1T5M0_9LAMI